MPDVIRLSILGSTGSIGQSALSLVDLYPDRFEVVALAAGRNSRLLLEQCERYRPNLVALYDPAGAQDLRDTVPGPKLLVGTEGVEEVARFSEADTVVSAIMGAAGLVPTYRAIEAGKKIALANKETLVMAGELLLPMLRRAGDDLLPVDSEHSALHQCLRGSKPADVRRLVLTASGGPFRNRDRASLASVTVAEALNHPTWDMGPKITIDSATLMNKGLEVIEAHHLFRLPAEQISVVIHPQSIVHSMVEFVDGTVLAQMGTPDMRTCLLYALAHPERWESRLPALDLENLSDLSFHPPDLDRFPCLRLAYQALQAGQTYPIVLNAANEVAVELFLSGEIGFTQIPALIESLLSEHKSQPVESLELVLETDRQCRLAARRHALEITRI